MASEVNKKTFDPRVKRLDLVEEFKATSNYEHGAAWVVFHQKKRGAHHTHVGLLHAPNEELALVLAKEQFGRRLKTTNLWVVRTENIFALDVEDDDMFASATSPEKQYREPTGFSVREKIEKFQEENPDLY